MLRILIGAVFAIVMLVQLLPLLRGESWGVLEAVLFCIGLAGLIAVGLLWNRINRSERRR
ncbi:hypothetical protein [Brevibacterium luteolum]|uniref:DUF202 domain-containing protein n=1 Tax=Brevibacterium luteolum TaxID=199591 RepID=A0A2N6PEV0_9MICO|nr:hypothetical protein [Brevibacterium luteolum]MBM7529355.1 putative membrane channel-forming protein YqfA (hemolysin III family) [Brevibacterium luteolum]MCT1656735.1 hypothetical protein [Brevibacterium luteolum]MCT1829649.1 hypothetical protein [Brevibacterium luteolum]MCT1921453.1 hypothetical protein [Brevibacterium luteolum]NNG79781.1 hypothetical protein [Brevibacterium luteolum]